MNLSRFGPWKLRFDFSLLSRTKICDVIPYKLTARSLDRWPYKTAIKACIHRACESSDHEPIIWLENFTHFEIETTIILIDSWEPLFRNLDNEPPTTCLKWTELLHQRPVTNWIGNIPFSRCFDSVDGTHNCNIFRCMDKFTYGGFDAFGAFAQKRARPQTNVYGIVVCRSYCHLAMCNVREESFKIVIWNLFDIWSILI